MAHFQYGWVSSLFRLIGFKGQDMGHLATQGCRGADFQDMGHLAVIVRRGFEIRLGGMHARFFVLFSPYAGARKATFC